MGIDGIRRGPSSAAVVASSSSPTTTVSTPTTPPPAAPTAPPTDVFDAAHDMRARVGAVAVNGATQTALPRLLDNWRRALLEAAAEDRADDEVIAPVLAPALQQAEAGKGEPLTRREFRAVERQVRQQLQQPWDDACRAHLADITRSPSTMQRTERDVLLAQRPRIEQLKDPFTPVIHNVPGARDAEIVLWESRNAIVLVDTFAPSPKALVVPKQAANLPTDLKAGALDELAMIAAHTSDAFLRATGCPPAGIWVNPPQHLTVKQLHVHVLPDVGEYTAEGAPARALLDDPALRPQLQAWFDVIRTELGARLGPATP